MSLMCSAFIKSFLLSIEESQTSQHKISQQPHPPLPPSPSLTEQLEVICSSLSPFAHTVHPVSSACPSSHTCRNLYDLIQTSYFHKFFLKCLSHLGSQDILNSTVQEALSKSHCLLAPPLSHPIQAFRVCQQSRAWLSVRSPRLGSIITKPENQTPLEFHQQERLGRFLALTPNLSSFYCYKQQRIFNM